MPNWVGEADLSTAAFCSNQIGLLLEWGFAVPLVFLATDVRLDGFCDFVALAFFLGRANLDGCVVLFTFGFATPSLFVLFPVADTDVLAVFSCAAASFAEAFFLRVATARCASAASEKAFNAAAAACRFFSDSRRAALPASPVATVSFSDSIVRDVLDFVRENPARGEFFESVLVWF